MVQDDTPQLRITVSKTGNGSGTVKSSPAGIDCGTSCSGTWATNVTLTATAAADSTFNGWSGGACAGTAACVVVGNTAVSVTASFVRLSQALRVTPGNGPNELVVTLTGWSGSRFDWITIAPVGVGNGTYGPWIYVGSLGTASTKVWRVSINGFGTFEARLFLNSGFSRALTSPSFSVPIR